MSNLNRFSSWLGLVVALGAAACGGAPEGDNGTTGPEREAPEAPTAPGAEPQRTPEEGDPGRETETETKPETETENPALAPLPLKTPRFDLGDLPRGMVPLYVAGDVNEDRKVDALDASLMAAHYEDGVPLACEAAADLTGNGTVDEADLERMAELMETGEVLAPPLAAQPYLPCEYRNPIAAATFDGAAGVYKVRFLDEALSQAPMTVEVDSEFVSYTQLGETVEEIEFHAGELELGKAATILFDTAEYGGFTFTITRTPGPQEDEDEGDDPRDAPPPTIYGEEIEDGVCPQRGRGCEALIIDLSYHLTMESDARDTRNALVAAGCNVAYVTPYLLAVPQESRWLTLSGWRTYPPDAHELATTKAHNQREYDVAMEAIRGHRERLREGRDAAIQIVNGHGSDATYGCGYWSTGYHSNFWLSRADFHQGNYEAARRNVCSTTAEDWSCYAGLTPMALDELNNLGTATCRATQTNQQPLHAGFEQDVALGSSTSTELSLDPAIWMRDNLLSSLITKKAGELGPQGDYRDLIDAFLLEAVDAEYAPSGWSMPAHYSDRGYAARFPGGESRSY